MKVTLQVHGRERTFSEEYLRAILEKYFPSETTPKTPTAKVVQKPTEDAWFEIKPQAIDQKLFEKKREDNRQEATRNLILEAFTEMKDNPEKYGKNFKTMMPKKTWNYKTVEELKELASKLGNHNANWVEQAFEWAQRIANGESWKNICNANDTANCYRLVEWKDGYHRLVGGSVNDKDKPASNVGDTECFRLDFLLNAIPLVVLYE